MAWARGCLNQRSEFPFKKLNKMNATYNLAILAHGREVEWIQISTGIYVAGHISSFLFRSAFAHKSKNTTCQYPGGALEVNQTHIVFTERKYRHEVRSKNEKSRSRVNKCVHHLARRKEGIPPHPCWIASLINPNLHITANVKINLQHWNPAPGGKRSHLFLSVKSAVPGRALRLSAAPPTTIVIAEPGPDFKMFEHDCLLTLQTPRASKMSR